MALDGSFTLYDLDELSGDGTTFTVTVGVALLVLRAVGQQPVIGETISLGNPDTGQPASYTVVGSSAGGLLLTDGNLAYLLGEPGIPRGTLVQTEANTTNTPCFVAGTRS